jgi:hypothetical protein
MPRWSRPGWKPLSASGSRTPAVLARPSSALSTPTSPNSEPRPRAGARRRSRQPPPAMTQARQESPKQERPSRSPESRSPPSQQVHRRPHRSLSWFHRMSRPGTRQPPQHPGQSALLSQPPPHQKRRRRSQPQPPQRAPWPLLHRRRRTARPLMSPRTQVQVRFKRHREARRELSLRPKVALAPAPQYDLRSGGRFVQRLSTFHHAPRW